MSARLARRPLCARVARPPNPPRSPSPYPRRLRAPNPALASVDGCTALVNGKYAKGSCNYEDDKTATLSVCTDPACSTCEPTSVVESEKCYISGGVNLPVAGETNVRMHCASEQTASASSVVVGLAVTLSLSAAAMCAFWVYKDKRAHKAEAAAGYSSV